MKSSLKSIIVNENSDYASEPEKDLMRAVLEEAIRDFRKFFFSSKKKRLSNSAFSDLIIWFLEDKDTHLYSFVNICNVLNINKKDLLKKIGVSWSSLNINELFNPEIAELERQLCL